MKRAHRLAMVFVIVIVTSFGSACSNSEVAGEVVAAAVSEERANNIRTILAARGIDHDVRAVDPTHFDVVVDDENELHARSAIEDGRYVEKPAFYGATAPRTPERREKARAVEDALLKEPGVVAAHVALLSPQFPGAEKAPWVHVGIVYTPMDERGSPPPAVRADVVARLVAAMTGSPEQDVIINSLRENRS